ncbi:hypothetical protein ITJ57_19005 [Plantibacter sp. VKM Ac-2880]|uniref:hypothetical protein n=1 Tax=Plantibacter sp. VKM Ac-2880 TaxID=2783827 RepID=UPI00188F28F9|nr:hypothetical protein [Plantibacter sp. VKM Ac-2880]MBF4570862.1 hypothetical protein [Plantibacter sp. VKM Ac-2880]
MTLHDTPDLTTLDSTLARELVIDVLRAAGRHEEQSHGAARRVAFRTTRYLIEGATRAGLPANAIADALDVKPGTLRTRLGVDGLVEPSLFAKFAHVTVRELELWRTSGQIELAGPDPGGVIGYHASELIAALVRYSLLTKPTRTASEDLAAAALFKPSRDDPPTIRHVSGL